jgi:hypothetical protein
VVVAEATKFLHNGGEPDEGDADARASAQAGAESDDVDLLSKSQERN